MGNKLNCSSNKRKRESNSRLFCPLNSAHISDSITFPSICEGPSLAPSIHESTKSRSSDSFKWSQMQSLILEQEHFTEEVLTPTILKIASQVMEILKRNIKVICSELQEGNSRTPDVIFDKFIQCLETKSEPHHQGSIDSTTTIWKKVIVHFVSSLYILDVILNHFMNDETEQALDFLKQVAVSHALIGVNPSDFRMMDWVIIRYLLKNKIVNEENVNSFIIYSNIISNYINGFYQEQSVRNKMMDQLVTEKIDDRNNKARENYRLMKRWKMHVDTMRDQNKLVEELLTHLQQAKQKIQENEESTDTLTLKQNDFIMKHFLRKMKRQDSTQQSLINEEPTIDYKNPTNN